MADFFDWIKALHVIAIISWMAGLLYLPRLFVNHVEQTIVGSDASEMLKQMEGKLWRIIMNPAMIVSWVCGLGMLALAPGLLSEPWMLVKLAAVIGLSGYHVWLGRIRRCFADDQNTRSGRFFRLMNEVPTLLMIVIVVMVIVKPF